MGGEGSAESSVLEGKVSPVGAWLSPLRSLFTSSRAPADPERPTPTGGKYGDNHNRTTPSRPEKKSLRQGNYMKN